MNAVDLALANAFGGAVQDAFRTLIGETLTRAGVRHAVAPPVAEISAIVGLAGPLSGACALGMSEAYARACAQILLRRADAKEVTDAELRDAAAELLHFASGIAQRMLAGGAYTFQCGAASVVTGRGHAVHPRSSAARVYIAFSAPGGEAVQLLVTAAG